MCVVTTGVKCPVTAAPRPATAARGELVTPSVSRAAGSHALDLLGWSVSRSSRGRSQDGCREITGRIDGRGYTGLQLLGLENESRIWVSRSGSESCVDDRSTLCGRDIEEYQMAC